MNKLLILQGIPASGKSTFAKEWAKEDPIKRIVISRDSIRHMLGQYWVPTRECLVSEIELQSVISGLSRDYDVCIDATNLNLKYLQKWLNLITNYPNYKIEYKKI